MSWYVLNELNKKKKYSCVTHVCNSFYLYLYGVEVDIKMNKKAAAREFAYAIPRNYNRDTNVDRQQNRHTAIRRASKLLNNVVIIPIKMRNTKTDIVIPPITADHKRTPVGHPQIGHIQTALKIRKKLMQHW
jgi:hypothetical protein